MPPGWHCFPRVQAARLADKNQWAEPLSLLHADDQKAGCQISKKKVLQLAVKLRQFFLHAVCQSESRPFNSAWGFTKPDLNPPRVKGFKLAGDFCYFKGLYCGSKIPQSLCAMSMCVKQYVPLIFQALYSRVLSCCGVQQTNTAHTPVFPQAWPALSYEPMFLVRIGL